MAVTAVSSVLRQAEKGEDTSFEFVSVIGPIVFMILTIAFVVVVRGSQMPAWSAASECARAAVATLDENIGRAQAQRAAEESLAGNSIKASSGQIVITGDWSANSTVTCTVSYNVDVSWIQILSEFTGGSVPVTASVSMRVERYKSIWN